MNLLFIIVGALGFISGAVNGFNQDYLFHFNQIAKKFPNMLPNSEAWKNKYKNNNPKEGKKFFGSTTFLVGFTDPYHFTNMISRWAFAIAFTLLGILLSGVWWHVVLGVITLYFIWSLGFHFTYTLIFR